MDGYQKVQSVAKQVLTEILPFIRPGVTEVEIAERCDALQRGLGVDHYWYADLPALVLVGPRTQLAISRQSYQPDSHAVAETDLVTIDLNPEMAGCRGDCARSYYVEAGVTRQRPQRDADFIAGFEAQRRLHARLFQIAQPDMTFDQCYHMMLAEAESLGFSFVDYIGHSIEKDHNGMRMVQAGSEIRLGDVDMFTLEPQIRVPYSPFAFKHENIYRFAEGHLVEL